MLGKLIYHEWKDTWKLITILNGAVIVLSVLGMIFAATGNITEVFKRNDASTVWLFVMYISFVMVYVLGIFALSIGTTLYFYVRFYRNLYTDQGYLMHTLPVTAHELILSKAIVAFAWKVIGTIVMCMGIGSIIVSFASTTGELFREIIPYGREALEEYIDMVYDGNAGLFFLYIIVMIITGIGGIIYSIFMGYAAISLGQQARKNKVLASVGIYFGINIAVSMATNMINQFIMLFTVRISEKEAFMPGRFGSASIGISLLMGIVVCILAVLFYMLSYRIMDKRLNLE